MNNDFLPIDIKAHLKDELEPAPNHKGNNGYICPNCGSGTGVGRKGKADGALSVTPNGLKWHCFSCNEGGDILDLVQFKENLDKKMDARKLLMDRYGAMRPITASPTAHAKEYPKKEIANAKPKQDPKQEAIQKAFIEAAIKALPGSKGEKYLTDRGFTADIITEYRLGYDAQRNAVVIPYPGTEYYTERRLQPIDDKKYYKPTGITEPLFSVGLADNNDTAFYTEGQLDAISLIQAGASAVAAIGGSGVHKLDDLTLPPLGIIVKDNDPPKPTDKDGIPSGDRTANSLKNILSSKGVLGCIVSPPEDVKDSNDLLKSDPKKLTELVIKWKAQAAAIAADEEAQKLAEHNAARSKELLTSFLDRLHKGKSASYVPTGFSELDKALDGGLYPGLYIMGAISSMGKTTLLLQLADQIAAAGHDVLYFSLEMGADELISKSLSRYTFENNRKNKAICKTSRGISTASFYEKYSEDEKNAISEAIKSYDVVSEHLYIYEGIGDIGVDKIKDKVADHIKLTGNTPLVFIDYLQILAPYDMRATDKQNTDKAVLELKRLSRDYKTAVVAISSFNRDNYSTEVNMAAFKESGAIEYGSDTLLAIQPKGMEAGNKDKNNAIVKACKAAAERSVELVILKQRSGKVGDKIGFIYNSWFNCFTPSHGFDQDNIYNSNYDPFNPSATDFEPLGTNDTSNRAKMREKIKAAFDECYRVAHLVSEPVTLYALAEQLDCTQATVKRYLKEYGGYTVKQDDEVIISGEVDTSTTVDISPDI